MNPEHTKTPSTPSRKSPHSLTAEKIKTATTGKQYLIKKKLKPAEKSSDLPQDHLELRKAMDGDPEVDYPYPILSSPLLDLRPLPFVVPSDLVVSHWISQQVLVSS